MATTWTVQPMAVARHKDGAAPLRNEQFTEAASSSYVRGTPLAQDASSSNIVAEWTASSSAVIKGVSLTAAGGASSAAIMAEVHEGTILEANAVNTSSATAIAATDLGATFSLVKDSSANWIVDLSTINSASVAHVRTTGLAGMAEIGDTNPRVEFIILEARRLFK